MSKNNKPQIDRNKKAAMEAKARQVENMPMNKDFLHAKDENGNLKYPIVDKLVKYKMLDFERILDVMRQISAFVAQIRHHHNRIFRLREQFDNDKVIESDENGRLLTKEEIQLKIISEKIAIPRDVSQIRLYAVDKLLPQVDGIRFTGEDYNKYVLTVNKSVTDLGYELFPEKLELIFPEL